MPCPLPRWLVDEDRRWWTRPGSARAAAAAARRRLAGWVALIGLLGGAGFAPLGAARADEPAAPDTERAPIPLLAPEDALRALHLPPGVRATLFAHEPAVRQPIGLATDARGRLWVAENDTYADRELNFDRRLHDRIVILADTDGDGRHDERQVFADNLQLLTSVEVGYGGVWAMAPPQLLFIPDRNGDDRPDGEPEVVLDGFDADAVRHNLANGLRWGPDGWLYGRHGIQATSRVGRPGTPDLDREALNCTVWRLHPTRRTFEVVARGTTNPWGMDWDAHGQLFLINTVIGHLWHVVPGAHFERMYGYDFNPHLYALLPQTADHFHWDTKEQWSDIRNAGISRSTDEAGGGHAHSGLLIYQGGAIPGLERNHLLTLNLHGRRANLDRLERRGAAYVGRHEPDWFTSDDPYFRGIELIAGRDGAIYVADWSDVGECHENDGVHRSSGRIYRLAAAETTGPAADRGADAELPADLAAADDATLARLHAHPNEWYVRTARRLLAERAAAGRDLSAVRGSLASAVDSSTDVTERLRALWALHVTGGVDEETLLELTRDEEEHLRVWSVRLLVDGGPASSQAAARLAELAARDPSGLVLLYLASAARRLAPDQAWPVVEALAARGEFVLDPFLPLMTWYALEPLVPRDPPRAIALAQGTPSQLLRRHTARRVSHELETNPAAVDALVQALGRLDGEAPRLDVLEGLTAALAGWRRAPAPAAWAETAAALAASGSEPVARLTRELSVVFGDGRALDAVRATAQDARADFESRRGALRALVEARGEGFVDLLLKLLDDRGMAQEAIRGLATCDDPRVAQALLTRFPRWSLPLRAEAVETLAARPATARALVAAVAAGQVARDAVAPFLVRQMGSFGDSALDAELKRLWPELRELSADKRAKLAAWQARLDADALAHADPRAGRALYNQNCGKCHKLFGEGGAIGPDLTGAQRANLMYLLENMVDPSATVQGNFRMSVVALDDGRILNGVVLERTERTLTLQTPTERVTLPAESVEQVQPTTLSLMPEGQLDLLKPEQVRDLVAYLMSPRQVPLPEGAPATGGAPPEPPAADAKTTAPPQAGAAK